MARLQFDMWKHERKPGQFDGYISRFTDGTGHYTDSWWSSPPDDIDHAGREYLQNPHRHPNVVTLRHDRFIKEQFKLAMKRLNEEEARTETMRKAAIEANDLTLTHLEIFLNELPLDSEVNRTVALELMTVIANLKKDNEYLEKETKTP